MQVRAAVHDGYRRLLGRSLETELRVAVKERADQEAIRVFAANLRELLLAAPLGPKRVLAVDPGFRTGCKAVCLDAQGALLHHETLFPHGSEKQRTEAERRARELIEAFAVESHRRRQRHGRSRNRAVLAKHRLPGNDIPVVLVNESGASVYSASEAAREEFPRSRPDRARRGVHRPTAHGPPGGAGQDRPQVHRRRPVPARRGPDGPQADPRRCGRELRQPRRGRPEPGQRGAADLRVRAGAPSGGQHRRLPQRKRPVSLPRRSCSDVPRLGPKAFEQCAGFLRIRDGEQPPGRERRAPRELPGGARPWPPTSAARCRPSC